MGCFRIEEIRDQRQWNRFEGGRSFKAVIDGFNLGAAAENFEQWIWHWMFPNAAKLVVSRKNTKVKTKLEKQQQSQGFHVRFLYTENLSEMYIDSK